MMNKSNELSLDMLLNLFQLKKGGKKIYFAPPLNYLFFEYK